MTSTLRTLFPVFVFIFFLLPASVFCTPIPQGSPQEAAPANHPAQAQVALAPGQVGVMISPFTFAV